MYVQNSVLHSVKKYSVFFNFFFPVFKLILHKFTPNTPLPDFFLKNERVQNREAKFKSDLSLHFLTDFTKLFLQLFEDGTQCMVYIWLIHQSKALIFYFDMKKFWNKILKILWKTDKVTFLVYSNLVCIYTHTLIFKTWNLDCRYFHKILKILVQNFFHVTIENQSFRLMG